jgi:hypothetical protein
MRFCQPHWDALRLAITNRGLGDFVSKDGVEAMQRDMRSLEGKPEAKDHFDPLMGGCWAICNRAMETLSQIGQSPLLLMASDPEHPERECPICLLNFLSAEHDKTCTELTCKKPKGLTFDDWIESVADHMKKVVEAMPLEKKNE